MSKTILIVDDALETLSLLEAILQGQGYAVTPVSSAKEALAKIQAGRPDLIILDVLMPETDGFALYKILRKERSTSTIPVLVLTVRARMEDTFRALGAEEFLAKPFDSEKLLGKIRAVFGENGAEAASVEAGQTLASSAAAGGNTATVTAPAAKTGPAATATKRVFVLAGSQPVIGEIKTVLASLDCFSEFSTKESEAIGKVLIFKPDILVLEAVLNDRSAADFISKFKQVPQMAKTPIIVFSFLDKDKLQGASVHQKATAIESARRACLSAGASDLLGGFDVGRFAQTLKKYL